MASLATPAEWAIRLNTTFDAGQTAQAQQLLNEASSLIRAATGQTLTLVVDDVFTRVAPSGRWLDLPQKPAVSVAEVTANGQPVPEFTLIANRLYRPARWDNRYALGSWWPAFPQRQPFTVTVKYTHGMAQGDERLDFAKGACMAIATQALENPSGQVVSESIDDYRVVFKSDPEPLVLPENLERRLVATYGRSAFTIEPAVQL